MDFALTEQQELIRKEVAALARTFSLDYWLEKDRKHEYPDEFVKAFADNGWLGLMIPEEFGGAGLGVTEAGIMLHEICASGAGTSGASPIHFYCFPPEPVVRYGTEELKRRELPRIVTGETVMSFGVTEPNSGTDTSRIVTRAEKKGDRWIVNGRKVWTTNAQHANRILLLTRTSDRDPAKPLKGMTLFFTEFDRKAITVREIEKLGRAGSRSLVRVRSRMRLACWALVVHTLRPLTIQRSPFLSARVWMREVSVPALGSVTPKAMTVSPVTIFGSSRCFSSSVP